MNPSVSVSMAPPHICQEGDIWYRSADHRAYRYTRGTWSMMPRNTEGLLVEYEEWQPYFAHRPVRSSTGRYIQGNVYRRVRWNLRWSVTGLAQHTKGYEYLDEKELFIWRLSNGT